MLSLKHLNTVSPGISQYANHSTFLFKPHCQGKYNLSFKRVSKEALKKQEASVYPNLLRVSKRKVYSDPVV